MKSNYKPTHQFLAYVVLFSLFLQSCGGFSNPPVLRLNQAKGQEKARSFIQRENIFAVVGQEFTTEKGYLVTFHEQDGNLAADVKIDSNQQKPNYTNVPVVVAKDTRLSELLYSELLYLEKTIQKRRIQVERSSRGRPSRIVIVRGGLKGGMMEGDEEKGEEKEQKGEIGSSANNNSGLLERALNGDAEAQFQLGNNLYYIWRYQYDDQAGKDAKLWLTRAAEQQHQQAISLLNIIDEIAVEIGADSELKKLLLDCARLNLNKVLPIILKQEININRNLFLGRGTFGDVFQATYQGKTVAIKEIKGLSAFSISKFAEFQKECIIMANHPHYNLITFLGFCPQESCLMMEYASGGSLWKLLEDHQKDQDWDKDWEIRYRIALDVAEGLSYLHERGIVHSDLKSENILLNSNGQAKIADFGTSALKSDNSTHGTWGGTYAWAAPETFLTNKKTTIADVYSYGMVLWQLDARRKPFPALNSYQIAKHIVPGNREEIREYIPSTIRNIIELCWSPQSPLDEESDIQIQVQQRPTMKVVRYLLEENHPDNQGFLYRDYSFIENDRKELKSQLEQERKQKEKEIRALEERLLEEKEKEKQELEGQLERMEKAKEELAIRLELEKQELVEAKEQGIQELAARLERERQELEVRLKREKEREKEELAIQLEKERQELESRLKEEKEEKQELSGHLKIFSDEKEALVNQLAELKKALASKDQEQAELKKQIQQRPNLTPGRSGASTLKEKEKEKEQESPQSSRNQPTNSRSAKAEEPEINISELEAKIRRFPKGGEILGKLKSTKKGGILHLTKEEYAVLSTEQLHILFQHPCFKKITLYLSSNNIADEGATKIAQALPNTQIHTLYLSGNQISAEGATKLAQALPNTQIHTLSLRGNKISDEGATKIAQALPNTQIHTLDLSHNNISDEGATNLAQALPNTQIHTLDLSDNKISAEGATKLSAALPNTQIHTLNLSYNKIADEGATKIAQALPNTQLHTLYLGNNNISAEMQMKLKAEFPKIRF